MPESGAMLPIQMLEVELSETLPCIRSLKGGYGERAWSLVRLHTRPLGMVELTLDQDGLTAAGYATQVWQALHGEIAEHLRQDSLPVACELNEEGLPGPEVPRCLHQRTLLLADAPFVTVVVPTKGRASSLAACLSSLIGLDYPNFEVIVVDNNPAGSPRLCLPDGVPQHGTRIRIVTEVRPGSSHARNRGLVETGSEFVAFVDDDAVVDRYWLAELVNGFGAGENVGVVTGLVIPSQLETEAQLWFELYAGFGKGFARQLFDVRENKPANPLFPYAAAMFGSGNNMAFRTSVLLELGAFDPNLGAGAPARGGEDLALFYRAISHSYQLLYQPAAIVHHAHRRNYDELQAQIYSYGFGLTAYLTSVALDDPKMLVRLVHRVPAALAYFLKTRSMGGTKKERGYPKELTHIEFRGMLYGPIAYLRGRLFPPRTWWATGFLRRNTRSET